MALKKREYDMTPWNVVGHSRPYTDRAIDALRRLDSGNRVVGSCVEYLSHLSLVLSALGKLKLCIPSYALTLALTT